MTTYPGRPKGEGEGRGRLPGRDQGEVHGPVALPLGHGEPHGFLPKRHHAPLSWAWRARGGEEVGLGELEKARPTPRPCPQRPGDADGELAANSKVQAPQGHLRAADGGHGRWIR